MPNYTDAELNAAIAGLVKETIVCPHCDGSGEIDDEVGDEVECERCLGSGISVPDYLHDDARAAEARQEFLRTHGECYLTSSLHGATMYRAAYSLKDVTSWAVFEFFGDSLTEAEMRAIGAAILEGGATCPKK